MSDVNFDEQDEQPTPSQEATRPQRIEEPKSESQSMAKYRPVIGDYIPSFAEMRLPRVNIVQNIGELQEHFTPGQIVYRQTAVLFSPEYRGEKATDPHEVVILGLLPKRWAERVEGGRGRLVSSPEEARQKGGTTDYDEWKLKKESGLAYFEPMAEYIVMLKQPKCLPHAAAMFPLPVDGERYALGVWGMKSSAYNNCAKFLFSDRQIGPTYEKGYPSCLYKVHTWLKTFGPGKSAWIPKFTVVGPTSETFQKFAKETIAKSAGVGSAPPTDQGPTED